MMQTRCPHCGTTFRVAAEQLKARQGRVRCGKCHGVFDAVATLVVAEPAEPVREAPAPEAEATAPMVPPPPPAPTEAAPPLQVQEEQPISEPLPEPEAPAEPVPVPEEAQAEAEPEPGPEVEPEPEFQPEYQAEPGVEPVVEPVMPAEAASSLEAVSPAEVEHAIAPEVVETPEAIEAPEALVSEVEAKLEVEAEEAKAESPPEVPEPAPEPQPEAAKEPVPVIAPEPLLHEEESPRRRWPWVLASLLALVALAVQALLHFRTEVIVIVPETRPFFAAVCDALGCELALPHKIDLIGIETSELSPDKGKEGRLNLSATLRNRAPYGQAWPHLEITLTDAQDRALLRRALAPVEYLPAGQSVAAGFPGQSEQGVQLTLDVGDTPAVGYRLYIFHP